MLRFLFLTIQCRYALTWRWSVLGIAQVHAEFKSYVLDLGENLQCSESWENVPLELHRRPVDSIQFSTLGWIHKPIGFLFPCAHGIFTDSSHIHYWIREYLGFCCWQLNCPVSQQSCHFPRILLPVDQGYSLNICLFSDQLARYIEQLFHCSLWRIFGWMQKVQIIITKMNCGLLGDYDEHSPHQRIHIEVFQFVFWLAFKLLPHVRVDFLEVLNISTRCAVIERPLRVVFVVDVGIFWGWDWCSWLEFIFACLIELVMNEILQSLSPKDRERESHPCVNPASREITSASVELCEAEVCFLHIQLMGTNECRPNMHKILPEVVFLVFEVSCKISVLKQT